MIESPTIVCAPRIRTSRPARLLKTNALAPNVMYISAVAEGLEPKGEEVGAGLADGVGVHSQYKGDAGRLAKEMRHSNAMRHSVLVDNDERNYYVYVTPAGRIG